MNQQEWYDLVVNEDAKYRPIIDKKIQFEASDLCNRKIADFMPCDQEDIAQELWLAVAESYAKYDEDRGGVTTFCYQQIRSARNLIIRKRYAITRRANLRTVPIFADIDEAKDNHGIAEAAFVDQTDANNPIRKYGVTEIRILVDDQAEPFKSALKRYLDGELESVAAMARECGMPISSFQRKVMHPFKRRFLKLFGYVGD